MSTLSCILSLVPCCKEKSISLVDRITYSQPDSNRYHCAALSKLHQLELDKRCILKYKKRQPHLQTFFKKHFPYITVGTHRRETENSTGCQLGTMIWIFCFALDLLLDNSCPKTTSAQSFTVLYVWGLKFSFHFDMSLPFCF